MRKLLKKKECLQGADWLFLLVVMTLALLLRLDFLIASGFGIESDEAIVGLMAKHILEGKPVPVFYYGQYYMGSFEALVAAGFFFLSGLSSVALKCVPLCFSIIFIVVIFLAAFELGGRRAARWAALLAALPPAVLVVWSAKARGGFIEVILVGTLALLMTQRWLKRDNAGGLGLIFIGLLLGFGWWLNNQIIYFMLPIGFFVLARLWGERLSVPSFLILEVPVAFTAGAVGFFVGGLPFWLYNFQHSFASFGMFKFASLTAIPDQLGSLATVALPIIIGGRRDWQVADYFPGSSVVAGLLVGGLLLAILCWRWRQVRALFRGQVERRDPVELFLLLLLTVLGVYVVSCFGNLALEPRYLLPTYTALFVLGGWLLGRLGEVSPAGSGFLGCALLALNLASCYFGGRALPGEPFVYEDQRASAKHQELLQWLEKKNLPWVRTNYWIGYRLAFESQERVRFLMFGKPNQVRIEDYEKEGADYGRDRMPLVLVGKQSQIVQRALRVSGNLYQLQKVSGYDVIYDITPSQVDLQQIGSERLKPYANRMPQEVGLAIDGKLETRWRSAGPQAAGMKYGIRLEPPVELRGLRYRLGNFGSDYPRGLKIEAVFTSGERKKLFHPSDYAALRYWLAGDNTISLYFPPLAVKKLILTQTGEDPFFDWSIPELELLQ